MATRKIVQIDNESLLRKKCRKVEVFDQKLIDLLDDMRQTMDVANGCGLAAPQVGILRQIAIVDTEDNYTELINPEIISSEGCYSDMEGCLSVPNKRGMVDRPQKIVVTAYDRYGNKHTITATDLYARAICHEIDHLHGVLFIDKIKPEQND